jgi:hypothetical protein
VQLEPADVLVDSMRGRSSTWTRIRINLRHVPEDQRPPQEALEVDFDPWAGLDVEAFRRGRGTGNANDGGDDAVNDQRNDDAGET